MKTVEHEGKQYKSIPYSGNAMCNDFGCENCDLAEKDSIRCSHPDECGDEYYIEVKQVD